MRGRFQEESEHLMDQVRNMGVQLEETLDACIDNVADKDVYIANNIIAKDDEFDNLEKELSDTKVTAANLLDKEESKVNNSKLAPGIPKPPEMILNNEDQAKDAQKKGRKKKQKPIQEEPVEEEI